MVYEDPLAMRHLIPLQPRAAGQPSSENAYGGDTESVRRREHGPWHMYGASTTSASRSQISMS
jgi:hypothetical protein